MRLAVAPDICRVSKSSSSANSPRGWRPLCASASARSESTRKMCFAGPLSRRERVRARACGRGLLCAANAAAASSSLIAVAGSFPSSTCRQSSRMSSSTSAWVCTKTRCAPAAAAANSSATRALRYFCCVAVTSSTSQWGRIARKRASCWPMSQGRQARRLEGLFLRRIRVGTIDEHQLGERRQIAMDQFHGAAIDAQHLGRELRMTNQRRPAGGGARGRLALLPPPPGH